MHRLKSIKNNVREFGVIHNDLFYKLRDSDYDLYQNDILIDKENQGYFGFDRYIGLNYKDYTVLIDTLSNVKTTIPVIFTGRNFYNNSFVISKNTIREGIGLYSSNYAICQLFPFEELYELPHRYYGSGYRFENQYIQIQNERKLLRSLSLLTGEYEWEVDLGGRKCVSASKEPPEDASIQQIIGIWEHQLLVFLDNNQILSLDINKGKILWELPDFDVHFPTGPSVAKAMHFHWYLENGKLYILKHHQYFSVDLNTQEVALLWQNEDKTYTINHCTYTENYIYFTAYGKEIEISILGVFNRKILQIDWLEKMIMPRMDSYAYVSFNQAPQVAENKLYVLDSGGTLHIFEREG
jgi:outer membrane protein assembly factor BamB